MSTGEAVYMLTPKGYTFPEQVENREFTKLAPPPSDNQVRIELASWVQENVFTEDTAELVGAFSIPDALRVNTDSTAGRIQIAFSNGASTLIGSGESVGRQLDPETNSR